jgi:hypothetical protein
MTPRAALVAGVCLLAFASPAAADTPPPQLRVAVVPGVAVNIDAARVDALSLDLATALATELEVEAIGGLEVRRRLPADGLPPDCVATPACTIDVARRLDVQQLLFVVMVDAGGAVQIDSTWVEPTTGKSISRPAIDIANNAEAKSRFASSATSLLPDAPVRPKPKNTGIDGETFRKIPRHFTVPSYITAGVAVVGLGIGIGFGIKAKGLYEDCDEQMAVCTDSQKDKIRNNALIADLGYIAALGGVVATAILYATSGSESRLIVNPNAEGGAGVTYVGRF